jgi:hypothetical protein
MSRTAFSLIPYNDAIRAEARCARWRLSAVSLIWKIWIACSVFRMALRREFELAFIDRLGKSAKSNQIEARVQNTCFHRSSQMRKTNFSDVDYH